MIYFQNHDSDLVIFRFYCFDFVYHSIGMIFRIRSAAGAAEAGAGAGAGAATGYRISNIWVTAI